ncbi:sel1 repeat family protein [Aquisalinus flavus]|nr:sel1 repeat family protein [Aquisalinus flavus]
MSKTLMPGAWRAASGALAAMLIAVHAAALAQDGPPGSGSSSLQESQRVLDQTTGMQSDLTRAKAAMAVDDFAAAIALLRPHAQDKAMITARIDFATACLGLFRQKGWEAQEGHEQDYVLAYEIALPLAEQGIAEFQYFVGEMLLLGIGTAVNRDAARVWLTRAAEQGHEEADDALFFEFEL